MVSVMEKYSKKDIINIIKTILNNLDKSNNKELDLKFSEYLLNKINTNDDITFNCNEIEKYLFFTDSSNKMINNNVFNTLKLLNLDMKDICFDNVVIKHKSFDGFKNVTIDINKIPDKDLTGVDFNGCTLKGNLDDAILHFTNFKKSNHSLILNLDTIKNKSLVGCNLDNVTIVGSFDGFDLEYCYLCSSKGNLYINPQKLKDKNLVHLNLLNINLVGEYDKNNNCYLDPSFDGCVIHSVSFKGCKGNIIININNLDYGEKIYKGKLNDSDITGIKVIGDISKETNCDNILVDSGYFDSNNHYILIENLKCLDISKNHIVNDNSVLDIENSNVKKKLRLLRKKVN